MKNKKEKKRTEQETAAEKDFPGYPHYPQKEDILNPESHAERVDADMEKISRSQPGKKSDLEPIPPSPEEAPDYTPDIVKGNAADLNPWDINALGEKDAPMDGGEDQTLLPKIQLGPDLTGDDLDVPGSELDDDAENIGSEDEENNYYSKGQE